MGNRRRKQRKEVMAIAKKTGTTLPMKIPNEKTNRKVRKNIQNIQTNEHDINR